MDGEKGALEDQERILLLKYTPFQENGMVPFRFVLK
jgi:hypothetical protein